MADAIVAVSGAHDDDSAEIVAEHLWAAVPLGLERQAAAALERSADVAVRLFAYERRATCWSGPSSCAARPAPTPATPRPS